MSVSQSLVRLIRCGLSGTVSRSEHCCRCYYPRLPPLFADWHVPDQYTLHRTQAADYFEADDFEALTAALTDYGQTALGCRSISPPWLSFYLDGSEQHLHADVPQGPLAYVAALELEPRWPPLCLSVSQ